MPQVLNGVGTWYWGKTNIRTRRGTCEFCGRTAELRSYDTTKFFVVLWVPLLPLGDKRIFNQCKACKRHRAMSLKKFKQLRDQELGQAISEYRRALRDAAKAEVAVAKAVGFEAEDEFLDLAKEIQSVLPNHAAVQARLGAAYAFFGKPQDAEAAYLRSLGITRDPEVQELLAVLCMRQGRPDDAAPLVRHVIDERQREKVGYVYLLAEAYQAAGRHEDALSTLQQVETAFPGIASEAEFSKYRTASLKARASGKPLRSTNLTPVTARASERRPASVLVAKLIGPAVALTALVIYLGACYTQGHSRRVWFVNGLDHPYDVDVNGQRVHLPANGRTSANLAEGEIALSAASDALPLRGQSCRIETPFFSRPFRNDTFVINPDKTALVLDEQTTYRVASYGPSRQPMPYHLHTGSLLYSFKDIDYEFVDFPSSIEMPKGHDSMQKTRVVLWTEGTPLDRILPIQKELGEEAVIAFARNYAAANPGDATNVPRLLFLLPPDESLALLRPHLDSRPVQVEFHRAYQNLVQRVRPEYDVEKEYHDRLQKEPDNSALAYLLGRIAADRKEGSRILEQACRGPAPCAYAFYALAYRALAEGDFQRSFDLSKEAQKLMPDNADFHAHEIDALLGLKRYDDALALIREARAKDPLDGDAVVDEMRVLVQKGDQNAAREVESSYLASHSGDNPDSLQRWKAMADGQLAYSTGDLEASAAAMAPLSSEPGVAFVAAYDAGRLEDAIATLAGLKSTTSQTHLLLYVAARQNGQADLAARQLAAAAEIFRKGDREERQIAGWLTSATPPDPATVCDVELLPDQKRVLLAAMGLRDPAHRDQYFQAASRFNFSRTFPYWTVKRLADAGH